MSNDDVSHKNEVCTFVARIACRLCEYQIENAEQSMACPGVEDRRMICIEEPMVEAPSR